MGDDLAGGLAGRRAAGRFERHRERRAAADVLQQFGGTLSRTGWPAAIRPSDAGLPPCGISHSSIERLSVVSSAAGTIVRLTPSALMAATKFGWLVLSAGQAWRAAARAAPALAVSVPI